MAAIAGELSKQIKGHSEGAQSFRPWWDTVEDNLLYSFVMLGMISLPMTFFSKTPIECTYHPTQWHNLTKAEGLTRFYPKVFCTETMIEPFLLYLPFTILMVPIVLTFIDKTFLSLYQVELKMNQFYHLLVKESLCSEDVSALTKDNVKDCYEIEQAFKTSDSCYKSYFYRTFLEIWAAMILAVTFSFHYGINGIGVAFFNCEVYGTLFECIVPNSRFFLIIYYMSFVFIGGYFFCSLYNFLWIVSPKVGALSSFLDGCQRETDEYGALNSGNSNNKNSFYSNKNTSLSQLRKRNKKKEGPQIRLKLYFKEGARDFKMLIDLLAESQGLPEAIRILALFEHQFANLWEPKNIRLFQKNATNINLARFDNKTEKDENKENNGSVKQNENEKENEKMNEEEKKEENNKSSSNKNDLNKIKQDLQTLVVTWNDAEIADYFYSCYKSKFVFEYSIEIDPQTEAPIKSMVYQSDNSWIPYDEEDNEFFDKIVKFDNMEKPEYSAKEEQHYLLQNNRRKYSVSFDGLETNKTYKIIFSTEINGRTVSQVIRNFDCVALKDE